MVYKECIDACLDCAKACDRCAFEGTKETNEHISKMKHCVVCAEVSALVGRLTAKGVCCKELYELCAKLCDCCADKCSKIDHQHAKDCVEACKKCADACRKAQEDCAKCEKEKCEKDKESCK